jgi:hypothetical protein
MNDLTPPKSALKPGFKLSGVHEGFASFWNLDNATATRMEMRINGKRAEIVQYNHPDFEGLWVVQIGDELEIVEGTKLDAYLKGKL